MPRHKAVKFSWALKWLACSEILSAAIELRRGARAGEQNEAQMGRIFGYYSAKVPLITHYAHLPLERKYNWVHFTVSFIRWLPQHRKQHRKQRKAAWRTGRRQVIYKDLAPWKLLITVMSWRNSYPLLQFSYLAFQLHVGYYCSYHKYSCVIIIYFSY